MVTHCSAPRSFTAATRWMARFVLPVLIGLTVSQQTTTARAETSLELRDRLDQLTQQVTAAEATEARTAARVASLDDQLTAQKHRRDELRQRVGERARAAYTNGVPGQPLLALVTSEQPAVALDRAATLSAVSERDGDLLARAVQADARLARSRALAEQAAAAARMARERLERSVQEADVALQAARITEAAAHGQDGPQLLPAQLGTTGEYSNGQLPPAVLAPLGVANHRLLGPAAEAFLRLAADAQASGHEIAVTDSYRPYSVQVELAARKGLYSQGGLAATPGTSNHGWGLSLDLDLPPAALAWMRANAASTGFVEDVPREPWHWTYRAA